MKKTNNIFIHNIITGEWEVNELKHPLVHSYRGGATTLLNIYETDGTDEIILPELNLQPLSGWEHIRLGAKIILKKVRRVITWKSKKQK